ncbi:MAG: DUF5103 domain-containing protein, partial [Parafilimonas sp.]
HVYLTGEMNGNLIDDDAKMDYNADKGIYEKTLFLKQGFYSYNYITKNISDKNKYGKYETAQTEGNYWETENNYTILVYYRSLSDRADELVGAVTISSSNFRNGY